MFQRREEVFLSHFKSLTKVTVKQLYLQYKKLHLYQEGSGAVYIEVYNKVKNDNFRTGVFCTNFELFGNQGMKCFLECLTL